jgi:Tol biopolymer transport system component
MRTIRWHQTAERIGLSTLPLLLLLSACSPDSPNPASPTDPATDAESSKLGCFGHDRECASARNGRIAWGQWIPYTGSGIFTAEPDGSDLKQLTFPEAGVFDDSHADWSPDGSTLLFQRDYAGDLGVAQIFRINADGSGLTLLTDCTGDCLGNAFPSYSPDGKHIAFIRWIGPVRPDDNATSGGVWIMNADGSNSVQVTQLQLPAVTENQAPNWSPDGRKLVVTQLNTVAEPIGHQAVVVMNVDGSGVRRITPWQLDATDADWSPDGRSILLTSHHDIVDPGQEQLYTVRPDGSGLERVVPRGLPLPANIGGKFSPDGRKIVFRHQTGLGDETISQAYTMNADGSDVRQVSFLDVAVDAPNWGTHR